MNLNNPSSAQSAFPPSVSGRRRAIGLAAMSANFVVMAGIAVLSSRSEDWQPLSLFLVLGAFIVAGEVLHVRRRKREDEMDWVFTSSAPLVVSMALLGPAPTLVLAVAGLTASDAIRRAPVESRISNLANYSTFIPIGGLAIRSVSDSLQLSPDDAAFAGLVMALFFVTGVLSCVHNAITGKVFWHESVWGQLRDEGIWLPIDAICAPLAGATVYVYATVGLGALGLLGFVHLAHQWLVGNLIVSQKRAEMLEQQAERLTEISASRGRLVGQVLQAEETERRRLAEALHDEALQNLLAAKRALSEPANGGIEHARTGIQSTIDQLRGAIFNLHPDVLQHAGLGPALLAVARQESDRSGFQVEVDVDPDVAGDQDGLLFVLAREQLTNVAKHSGATRVAVIVRLDGDQIVMNVRDNGKGMDDTARDSALERGHIGLASSAERLEAIGGRLDVESNPRSGTLVRTTLPRNGNGSVKDAAAHRLGDRG